MSVEVTRDCVALVQAAPHVLISELRGHRFEGRKRGRGGGGVQVLVEGYTVRKPRCTQKTFNFSMITRFRREGVCDSGEGFDL